jgi:membrane peptidoglycan carboxypeptidase
MRYLGAERSYARKLKEVLASVWLEGRLTKDEILTGYLNEVYLGANAQGMPAAARLYFDRNVSELSLSEAAMLAGLIRAPSQYNPLRDLDLAQRRANAVLQSMVANGVLSEAEAKRAAANPATLRHAATVSKAGGWFEDWAAGEAATLAGSFSGNVKVRTTLVPALQDLAETTIARMLDEVGPAHRISQAALVAMRPDGAVVAMVGGRDYQESQFNRAVQALRQPGSAFKLFVYLAALRSGYHADDVIDAGPLEVGDWSPENFGGRQYGRVTVADAFAQSINTATARLALDVGLDKVIEAARDLGIDATLPEHPSLALGAVEVSLLDLTGAYASVRSGLVPVEPFGILAIGGDSEDKLYAIDASSGVKEHLGQQPELIALLQRVVQAGTGRHAALDGFAAGKTGTSQNHRDAWFIGFSEDLVTGVWVGNDDGSPMDEVTGGSLPALIWKEFMTAAKPLAEATPVLATDESAPAFEEMIGTADGGSCDYQMCAAQYRSFRASDCTYQPFSGERRRCDIGSDGVAEAVAAEDLSEPDALVLSAEPDEEETVTLEPVATDDEPAVTGSLPEQPSRGLSPRSGGACNVAACAAKYSSFDPSNCTFQPFGDGPRQLCEFSSAESHARIGRDNTGDPLRHAEAVLRGRSADQSRPGRPPDACNVAVCAAFYSSFRAQDCTYQPFDGGPRRLCER